jgi:hypothetical protein
MTKMKVIRSSTGAIINIGDWDYCEQEIPSLLLDAKGQPIQKKERLNPLPEGAYEDEADIVRGYDGGLYEASDPRAASLVAEQG